MNESKFMNANLSVGEWLSHFFLLQFLPILNTLKGFILLGFFPAIASTFNIFYQWIQFKKFDLTIPKEFNFFYKKYFWQANQLGWGLTFIGAILLFDLYVSSQFIQSLVLHSVLLILFFIFLVVSSYAFIVFVRYDLKKIGMYYRQAFFIGFTSIFQSIAILLTIVLLYMLFQYVPFIALFFGLPLLIGGISWFAIQGVQRAEKMRKAVND